MKTVDVHDLKNQLSRYLKDVKAGEEILARDHEEPIARIVPLGRAPRGDDELVAMAALGNIHLGEGEIGDSFWRMPAPRVRSAILRRAVEKSR